MFKRHSQNLDRISEEKWILNHSYEIHNTEKTILKSDITIHLRCNNCTMKNEWSICSSAKQMLLDLTVFKNTMLSTVLVK